MLAVEHGDQVGTASKVRSQSSLARSTAASASLWSVMSRMTVTIRATFRPQNRYLARFGDNLLLATFGALLGA